MNAEHYAAIVRNHPKCTNPETCVICTLIAEIERLRSGLASLRSHIVNHGHPEDGTMCTVIDALLGGKG